MTLHLTVKPGGKVDKLFYDTAGKLTAKIKAPAQGGKANAYVVEFLAKSFAIAKSNVVIVAGFTNSHKRIEVNVSEEAFARFRERVFGKSINVI